MVEEVTRFVTYLLCFALSFYALSSVDYNRFIRLGKTTQAQVLHVLLSLALGYLVASFLLQMKLSL
ncbi:MAG: DUF1146 domain-containing protein [Erysipelotrichaceae bacterium]|nr:DUF1146 domain-containing protein [Erysipelotrichaceae bacterium]